MYETMNTEFNREQNKNFDAEFKSILRDVRPYILNLKPRKYIDLCFIWMKKLDSYEKKDIRNTYMLELCRQIKISKLSYPFLDPPPPGKLESLNNNYAGDTSSWSDISGSTSYITFDPQIGLSKKIDTNMNEIPDDINDINDETLIKFDQIYEQKISKFNSIIYDLQYKNEKLSNELDKIKNEFSKLSACTNHEKLFEEINTLQEKIKDLHENKSTVEHIEQYNIHENWAVALRMMEDKLLDTSSKTNNLRQIIHEVNMKLTEFTNDNNKIHDLYRKEISFMEERHVENISELKKLFEDDIQNKNNYYENRIYELKLQYENQIAMMQKEFENSLRMKDIELNNLNDVIQDQYKKLEHELISKQKSMESVKHDEIKELQSKIQLLQSYVLKMDRNKSKLEKAFVKKIKVLKREKELKERLAKIQLSTQRAEIIADSSFEQQKELTNVITKLEKRYGKLINSKKNEKTEE